MRCLWFLFLLLLLFCFCALLVGALRLLVVCFWSVDGVFVIFGYCVDLIDMEGVCFFIVGLNAGDTAFIGCLWWWYVGMMEG